MGFIMPHSMKGAIMHEKEIELKLQELPVGIRKEVLDYKLFS
jgi:hypothetical protein